MDRLEIIKLVAGMIEKRDSAEEIVDEMIAALTPTEDGEECPICGICP